MAKNETDVHSLLHAWSWRAKRAALGHYETARRLDQRHYYIGVTLVIFSVISTTLAGRTLFGLPNTTVDSFMTLFSALTLTVACVHVFLQDQHRADKYRRSGARYAALKRELEQVQSLITNSPPSAGDLTNLRERLDALGDDALPIPTRVWKATDNQAQKDKRSFKSAPENPSAS
jgi:hypothetical protein